MWGKHRAREKMDERLSAYIDGALSPSERARLERQLAEDPTLRARLEALRRTVALIRELPPVPAPRNFLLSPAMVARSAPPVARRLAPALTFATAISGILCLVLLVANLTTAGWSGLAAAPVPPAREAEVAPMTGVAVATPTPQVLQASPSEEAMRAKAAQAPETATPAVPWLGADTPSLIESMPSGMGGGMGGAASAGPELGGTERRTEEPTPPSEMETPPVVAAVPEETAAKVPPSIPTPAAVPAAKVSPFSSWLPVGGMALLTLVLAIATIWTWRRQ